MKFHNSKEVLAIADAAGWRRVLVVTALPLEMVEVRRFTEHVASSQSRDGNVFELSHFSGTGSDWLVIVGESGPGNHQASQLVTHACSEFGPFELIVLVGVAATRKSDDAPIGSVVAAEHVYWPYVGKSKDGEFQGRPRDIPINRQLLGFVRKVARDGHWHERLTPPYGGISPDHKNYPQPFPPTARVAQIVSVESVSADVKSPLEAQITRDYQDATALEMEGYGAMFAALNEETPCVVIRGISDDRAGKDPTLDKIHQPIAAAHAAAFAYEVLDLWGENRRPPETRSIVVPPAPASPSTIVPLTQAKPKPDDGTAGIASEDANADKPIARQILVLNFAGDEVDFPPDKQRQLVEAVRQITGNPTIEIVGTEIGSFHLFVEAGPADLVALRSVRAKAVFLEECDAELVSVATKEDFEAALSDAAMLLKASAPVLEWPRSLPDGTSIERPELFQLLNAADDDSGHVKALLGDPGSGKTALLAALAHELQARKIPFLAIKADFLDTSTANEEDLKHDLGLLDLPSNLLERLSYRGPVFLLVDQLDALAGYVDLRTGRLSVLLNLVRALGNRRNVHVVLSARRFEYEHDARLKTIQAESVVLELPPWSTVLKILEANGIQAAGWPADAQQVMRSPQSLATYLRLPDASKAEPFANYQKMLERLWTDRILQRQNGSRLSRLTGRIAEDMAERETLWLASSRYDDEVEELKVLLAERILTQPAGSPGSIGFSHQTIFDHALARAFAQKEGRLSAYVAERTNSLFIRPKMWAAMTYLREVEPASYASELLAIWQLPQLRLHLRHLLLEFLGQQSAPIPPEVDIVQEALASEDRRIALQSLIGSPGWFEYFKDTEIARAMASEAEANVAAALLSRACEFASSAVVALLEKHWLPNSAFDSYGWNVLLDVKPWTEASTAIATAIIERTDISPFTFDHLISTIGTDHPDFALQLVAIRLRRLLTHALTEADERARSEDTQGKSDLARYMQSPSEAIVRVVERSDGWDSLEALAKINPGNFVAHFWPWFEDVLKAIKNYKEDKGSELSYPLSYILDFRFEDEGTLDLPEHSLLGSLRVAVESLAASDQSAFLNWFSSAEKEDSAPAQRLLAHAMATQAERYASTAYEFLIANHKRFDLGSIEDLSGTSKRLVKAVAPFWSDRQIHDFARVVSSFAPIPDAGRDARSRQAFHRHVERTRYELLSALPSDRLPKDADALVKQGERKFGDSKRGATFTGPRWVGPSMSANEIDHADDEDILNAFEKLPDSTGWDNPKSWIRGGNIQLSRAFAEFAKSNPERAMNIIRQFPPEAGTRAAGYAIDAMAESAAPEPILTLVKELEKRGFSGEEYHGDVARAVEKFVNRELEIDDDTLAILKKWLEISPTAETTASKDDELDSEDKPENAAERKGESILFGMGGLSILPHGNYPILEAIVRVYLQRQDYAGALAVLSEHLKRPEQEKVWLALLRLFPFIRADDKAALSLFYNTLFAKYPSLAVNGEAAILLAHLHWTVPDLVREILVQWKRNQSEFVQQAFGELATLIALMQPKLQWAIEFLNNILAGDPSAPSRTGAAFAAVHAFAETDKKDQASKVIALLCLNSSESTWRAIVDLFRLVDEITPDVDWVRVLHAIADAIPRQPKFMSTFVTQRLQTLLPHEAVLVGTIAKALVDKWKADLGDVRTSEAAIAPELVDIAITLHRLSPRTRETGLQIFEQLLSINAYTARETLDQVDSRFRPGAPAVRQRLPRRTPKRRRRRTGSTG
ncbi:phosphorylase family protein [Bradyrhizobium liaoningense]